MVLRGPRRPGDTLPPPQVTQASSTLVTMETIALRGCSPLVSVTTMSSPKSQKSCLKWGGGGKWSQPGDPGVPDPQKGPRHPGHLPKGTQRSRRPYRKGPRAQQTLQKGPKHPADPLNGTQLPGKSYRKYSSIHKTLQNGPRHPGDATEGTYTPRRCHRRDPRTRETL